MCRHSWVLPDNLMFDWRNLLQKKVSPSCPCVFREVYSQLQVVLRYVRETKINSWTLTGPGGVGLPITSRTGGRIRSSLPRRGNGTGGDRSSHGAVVKKGRLFFLFWSRRCTGAGGFHVTAFARRASFRFRPSSFIDDAAAVGLDIWKNTAVCSAVRGNRRKLIPKSWIGPSW